MTVYKLTVNLDATLAVQNENGSFHYFKPSVGAEITIDETEDLTVLNKKFIDLYDVVIGPNFSSMVTELLTNPKSEEKSEKEVENNCMCTDGAYDDCKCKPLEVGEKPESSIVHYDSATLLPIESEDLHLAKKIYHEGPQKAYVADGVLNNTDAEGLPKEEWE